MNEQNEKLLKVKKSCKAVKITARVLFIITVIIGAFFLVVGSILMSTRGKYDDKVQDILSSEHVTLKGSNDVFTLSEDGTTYQPNLHSDIDSLNEKLSSLSLSFAVGLYFVILAIACTAVAVTLRLFYHCFKEAEKSDTPFSDVVIRKVLLAMIILSLLLFFTTNAAVGVLAAFMSWAIYTIMDYGKTLQIQSDETL